MVDLPPEKHQPQSSDIYLPVASIGPEHHQRAQNYLRYQLLEHRASHAQAVQDLFPADSPTLGETMRALREGVHMKEEEFNPGHYDTSSGMRFYVPALMGPYASALERNEFGLQSFYADGQLSALLSVQLAHFADRLHQGIDREETKHRKRLEEERGRRGSRYGMWGGPG